MRRMEITLQIEKHKAIVKKYNTVSGVVGYLKFIMIPLVFAALCFVFIAGLPAELFIVGLLVIVALWTYHNKVRKILDSSNEIITNNKRLLNEFQGSWTPYVDGGPITQRDLMNEPGMETSFSEYVEHFYSRKNAENSALNPVVENPAAGNFALGWDDQRVAPSKKAIRFLLM